MPYIRETDRERLAVGEPPRTPGELNYNLTRAILAYLGPSDKWSYASLNEVLGVLEACKLEFYRRAVAAYEDVKAGYNGDVYPPQDWRWAD